MGKHAIKTLVIFDLECISKKRFNYFAHLLNN
jgi:hypothetical protein